MQRFLAVLCLCVLAQLMHQCYCFPPAEAEARARMEEKAMSSISLESLEKMVEEAAARSANPTLLLIKKKLEEFDKSHGIKNTNSIPDSFSERSDVFQEEINPLKKGKKYMKKSKYIKQVYQQDDTEIPVNLEAEELKAEATSDVAKYYEAFADQVMSSYPRFVNDDMISHIYTAASDYEPSYVPTFDYNSYSYDPTEAKLSGKSYWKEPEGITRRQGDLDDKGCKTIVKEIKDPKEEKDPNSQAKSVIITRECEYPNGYGPDAQLPQGYQPYQPPQPIQPKFIMKTHSHVDSSYSPGVPQTYQGDSHDISSTNTEPKSEHQQTYASDPLAPDYIDKMLETHFKNFPSYKNPLSFLRNYQEKFTLKNENLDDKAKEPVYHVHTYEHNYPEPSSEVQRENIETHRLEKETGSKSLGNDYLQHNFPQDASLTHHDVPLKRQHQPIHYQSSVKESGSKHDRNSDKLTEPPKMMKKSFAYYRKDNPKEDPNNQEYAEEYAQGNYRSFSSEYDSERDNPKQIKKETA